MSRRQDRVQDGQPVLQVRGVRKAFGGLQVAQDIDLEVRQGTVHALIGPNGAGKTTLLAQICGEIIPDGGRILLNGQDITTLAVHARARLGLARSFQITSLLNGLSVFDNVLLAVLGRSASPWRMWGNVRRQEPFASQARALLEEAGLARRADDDVLALSHGEQRQLELVLALAASPALLLLDEPMAGLSAAESAEMTQRLMQLKGHHAMLLVEHDMDAVFALADTVSVLVNGRIIASGPPEVVRANAEVQAAYLGEGMEEQPQSRPPA